MVFFDIDAFTDKLKLVDIFDLVKDEEDLDLRFIKWFDFLIEKIPENVYYKKETIEKFKMDIINKKINIYEIFKEDKELKYKSRDWYIYYRILQKLQGFNLEWETYKKFKKLFYNICKSDWDADKNGKVDFYLEDVAGFQVKFSSFAVNYDWIRTGATKFFEYKRFANYDYYVYIHNDEFYIVENAKDKDFEIKSITENYLKEILNDWVKRV